MKLRVRFSNSDEIVIYTDTCKFCITHDIVDANSLLLIISVLRRPFYNHNKLIYNLNHVVSIQEL